MLNVGANVGAQTLPLGMALSSRARVIAVEPADAAFQRLERNLSLNPVLASRVCLMHMAQASTLDTLMRTLEVTRLDLIKLDVDGHELLVLRGARETLARLRPTVVFEFCPYLLAERHEPPDALLPVFDAAGYALHEERGAPITDRARLMRSIPHGASANIVAMPR